ncbi:MAG TPA: hypothetical protein VIH05_11010 [Tepidiformaceae bacterium]|jgi:hypothetical protein
MAARAPQPLSPAFPPQRERSWFTTSTVALVISVILALAFAFSPIGLVQPDNGDGGANSGAAAGR